MHRRILMAALGLFTFAASAFAQNDQRGGRGAQAGRGAQGGGGSRYIDPAPINFNDHEGWIQMFDGSTLKGWDGPADLWHIENGAIVVQ